MALSKQWNYESYETLAKRVVALEREINKISPPEQEWTSYRVSDSTDVLHPCLGIRFDEANTSNT